jgi:hypothetical protein
MNLKASKAFAFSLIDPFYICTINNCFALSCRHLSNNSCASIFYNAQSFNILVFINVAFERLIKSFIFYVLEATLYRFEFSLRKTTVLLLISNFEERTWLHLKTIIDNFNIFDFPSYNLFKEFMGGFRVLK